MAVMTKPILEMNKISEQNKFIFHVDLDCFYAAIEMREDPSLVNVPLVVGGDKETQRGVVLTCNYNARKYGIRSGMSLKEALQLCPDIVCSPKIHSKLYKEASNNIMSILSSYTNNFQSASIDEAYLDLSEDVISDYNYDPIPLAIKIKQEILEEEEITCSIGIGPNKTIAKMATSKNKPNGITFVPKERIKHFLYPLKIKKLIGIGEKSAQRIKKKYGIETIGQIINLETKFAMIRKFGDLGKFFYRVISGEGKTTINPRNPYGVKSISKGRTFYGLREDGELITAEKLLPRLIDQVHERLTKKSFRFKTVTLEVKIQNGLRNFTKSKSFLAANDDKERITRTAFELLDEFKNNHKNELIRKIAVRVSNFEKLNPHQKTITEFITK